MKQHVQRRKQATLLYCMSVGYTNNKYYVTVSMEKRPNERTLFVLAHKILLRKAHINSIESVKQNTSKERRNRKQCEDKCIKNTLNTFLETSESTSLPFLFFHRFFIAFSLTLQLQ